MKNLMEDEIVDVDGFTNNIRKYRKEYGLSQEELGKLIGVSRQMISNYEHCDRPVPLKYAFRLERVLKTDIHTIFGLTILDDYHEKVDVTDLTEEQKSIIRKMASALRNKNESEL